MFLKALAEAYARKTMFDKAIECHQRALKIVGKTAAITQAIAELTERQFDFELNQLDSSAPDYSERREQIENRRLEFEWREMATTH